MDNARSFLAFSWVLLLGWRATLAESGRGESRLVRGLQRQGCRYLATMISGERTNSGSCHSRRDRLSSLSVVVREFRVNPTGWRILCIVRASFNSASVRLLGRRRRRRRHNGGASGRVTNAAASMHKVVDHSIGAPEMRDRGDC